MNNTPLGLLPKASESVFLAVFLPGFFRGSQCLRQHGTLRKAHWSWSLAQRFITPVSPWLTGAWKSFVLILILEPGDSELLHSIKWPGGRTLCRIGVIFGSWTVSRWDLVTKKIEPWLEAWNFHPHPFPRGRGARVNPACLFDTESLRRRPWVRSPSRVVDISTPC